MGSAGLPAMTIEEWADLDEDEPGELVDGRLEEEEVPSYLHEAVVAWFFHVLRAWAVTRGGWVFGSESKFAVAPRRGRKPDVSVFFPGAPLPGARDGVARVPPQIMVEVLSPRPRRSIRISSRPLPSAAAVRNHRCRLDAVPWMTSRGLP